MRIVHYLIIIVLLSACQREKYTPNDGTAARFDDSLKPFYHGVASGDPLQDRVIIWTRVTPEFVGNASVEWSVATDDAFSNIVQSGKAITNQDKDYTVKIDVTGLEAGTTYYYKFKANDAESIVGRTRTAPAKDSKTVKLAVASCSNYEGGFFNAYANLAKQEEIDAVLHLGDYIYEYAPGTYCDTTLGRFHLPENEIISLQDYRTRYAQYRLDADLRKVHQMHPFITIWDDHEITNNAYIEGAQNHQPDEEGDYNARKAIARQVYYEWLPIREQSEGQLYRQFDFGNLADIVMLDERIEGRTAPVENHLDSAYRDAERTMLGEKQYNWLTQQLENSKATWKIIGNQVIFSRLDYSGVFAKLKANMDAWDGYPTEKQRIKDFLAGKNIQNTVFVSGDSHCSWAFEIPSDTTYQPNDPAQNVAVEFGSPGISSSNYDENFPIDTIATFEQIYQSDNPHLKYVNLSAPGYFILTLTADEANAQWFYADKVNVPSDKENAGMMMKVKAGVSRLEGVGVSF